MIAGIILAAGRGERFGGGKLLAKLPSGKTILETTVLAMSAALPSVTLVVRRDAALTTLADRICRANGAVLVVNERADDGMATSIACGVGATVGANVGANVGTNVGTKVEGWLIALADMPYVKSATMSRVASQITNATMIVVPTFEEQRGHPVGFGLRYFAELQQLAGDGGARAILQGHPEHVLLLPVDDSGIVKDIDTPADLGGHELR